MKSISASAPRILLALAIGAVAAGPLAAAGRPGFIRFEGITGDGGDAEHPGSFFSQFLDVAGLMSGSGSFNPNKGGSGSLWLPGGGPGFDALVRACLSRQNLSSAEVAFGSVKYVLEGVALDGIHVYGPGAASGGGSGKGPVVVSFRFASLHEVHAPPRPGVTTRAGSVNKVGTAPLLLANTPTPTPPRLR